MTRVNGETTPNGIANTFCEHFKKVYSNGGSPQHELLRLNFLERFALYETEHANDSIAPYFISWSEMMDVMAKMKIGKSNSGKIRPEHVFYGSPKLTIHLHFIFNAMIQHGIVVDDFLRGTITPIVKDNQGEVSDPHNYRGITLGGLFSKLFEFALDAKLSPYLGTDNLQFGFKKKTSQIC